MRLEDLVAATGENARQIRYLISEGVVPRPDGRTGGASYGERHVEAVRAWRRMRSAGMRLSDIRRSVAAARPLEAEYAPGVRLTLDPLALGWSSPDPDRLAEWVRATLVAWNASPSPDRTENDHAA